MSDIEKKRVKNANTHSGHRARMAQRFMHDGFDNYRPHEVLEQILYEVIPRSNTNPAGHALIDRFGSVGGVINASAEELLNVEGVGKKSAEFLSSLPDEMTKRILVRFREIGEINVYHVSFLADWFLNFRGCAGCVVIVLSEHGKFDDIFMIPYNKNTYGEFNAAVLWSQIKDKCTPKMCIIVCGENDGFSPENMTDLRDIMLFDDCNLIDAYVLHAQRPLSLIHG